MTSPVTAYQTHVLDVRLWSQSAGAAQPPASVSNLSNLPVAHIDLEVRPLGRTSEVAAVMLVAIRPADTPERPASHKEVIVALSSESATVQDAYG